MSLLNNYVAAVKRQLPAGMRDDVGEELHSTLSDSIDALEEATGHPLNDEQVADLLKRRGHPLLVASAYRGDRGLIGAQLFPSYVRVLKAGFVILAAVVLADYLFGTGAAEPRDLARLFYRIYWPALQLFTWVTLAFHVTESWMERSRFLQRWDPLRLPAAVDTGRDPAPALRRGLLSIAVLVLLAKFLLNGALLPGAWLQRPSAIAIGLGPDWLGVGQWVAAGLCAAVIALAIATLVQGYWNRIAMTASVVLGGLLALVLLLIVFDPDSVVLAVRGQEPAAQVASLLLVPKVFIGVVAAGTLYEAARRLRALRDSGAGTP